MLMRTFKGIPAALMLFVICMGCNDARRTSSTAPASNLWLELRTVSGYPVPGRPVDAVHVFQVTQDRRAFHRINGTKAASLTLAPADFEMLREMVEGAALHENATIPIDAPATILDVYREG